MVIHSKIIRINCRTIKIKWWASSKLYRNTKHVRNKHINRCNCSIGSRNKTLRQFVRSVDPKCHSLCNGFLKIHMLKCDPRRRYRNDISVLHLPFFDSEPDVRLCAVSALTHPPSSSSLHQLNNKSFLIDILLLLYFYSLLLIGLFHRCVYARQPKHTWCWLACGKMPSLILNAPHCAHIWATSIRYIPI